MLLAAERVVVDLQQQIDALRDLSTSLAFYEAEGAGRVCSLSLRGCNQMNEWNYL